MEQGHIKPRPIEKEMEDSFLDYSMSVIIDRALPDVRDGLKPVHRRILTTLHDLNLTHAAKYRKSAKIAGDVSGNYHPHGEAVVYPSMSYLAQDFRMRYPVVEGQGNFGSIDGDPPAAMRYTEARMEKIAEEMLRDIEKDTVDYRPNYDNTRKEPMVLPTRVPQLLMNGSIGIAVGMATSIPPHNLGELIDGLTLLIEKPNTELDELTDIIKGPDFPTGGVIFDKKEIKHAYATGRGGIVTRAKADIEETKTGAFRIIVTEIPFMVNKSTLIEHIADLVRDKKLEGIRDLRDESDRDGIRMVVDLKKDAYPKKVLNQLFKHTQLQQTFHINMLALVDGIQPRLLNIKEALQKFLEHREVVVVRRTKFDLARAKARAHILEGLKKALDHIDAIISLIKKSKTREIAHAGLMKTFTFSDLQATAILEMKLATLSGLERKKIEDELKQKRILIKELEGILKNRKLQLGIIKTELKEIKEKHADERRTQVMSGAVGEFSQEDLVPNEEIIMTLTRSGYIKRVPSSTYKAQGRGGKGIMGMTTKEEDMVDHFFTAMAHDDVLFFTNQGRVFQTKVYEIPEASRQAKGQAIVNFLQLGSEEMVTAVIALEKGLEAKYLTMATVHGTMKKTSLADFSNVRRSGLIAIKLKTGDQLKWVRATSGQDHIMLATKLGQAIRFKETDIRPMGRTAAGVRAIKLHKDDHVIGMDNINRGKVTILNITEKGMGKQSPLTEYKVQKRGGSGIKTAKVTAKTGHLISMDLLNPDDQTFDLVVITRKGQVLRTPIKSVSTLGRATQGVRVMKFKEASDTVASIAIA